MELWVIRHEYRDEMEAWALAHFGVLRSPGRPSATKLRVEVGSVLLITIGVMGELGAGIEITSINGVLRGKSAELRSKNAELRSKSDQLLALVTQQAGEAKDSALIAKASAKAAGIAASKAQKKADEVENKAADLLTKYTAAEKELEATFMRTRPRMMQDNKKFQDALKGKPKADVEILFKPEDEEAYMLGAEIRARLTDIRPDLGAGWTVSILRPLTESDTLSDKQLNHHGVPLALRSGAWHGLGLVVKSLSVSHCPPFWLADENEPAVCALQNALMQSGAGGGQITFDPRMHQRIL